MDFGDIVRDILVVAIVLVILRYFIGASALLQTGSAAGVNLFDAFSGLNKNGQTAGYAQYN